MEPCRCGHTGDGPHPCHGNGYTCRKPAEERLYDVKLAPLAGHGVKLTASFTWACDDCWQGVCAGRKQGP